MQTRCPACQTTYDVPEAAVGKTSACKRCGDRFAIHPVPPDAERVTVLPPTARPLSVGKPITGRPVASPAETRPLSAARPPRSPLVPIGLAVVAVLVVIAAGVWVIARGTLSDSGDKAKAEALRAEWAVLQKEQDEDQEYRKRIDEGKSGREYMTEKQRRRADRGFAILDEYKAIRGRHPDWQLPPLN